MTEILVLAEHRRGEVRDITLEMLTKGRELAKESKMGLTAVLLGKGVEDHAKTLSEYAEKVLLVEDVKLENFNSETYKKALTSLIDERRPLLIMMGHTSFGVDLAPRLAASLRLPLATDCIDLALEGETFTVTRQMYGGKVNVKARLRKAEGYIVTIRQAAFEPEKSATKGKIERRPCPFEEEISEKRFVEYVLPPPGGVDITAADKLVGVGRGIKDEGNLAVVEDLAKSLGGVLACSRPIVDKGWLPNDRQVGTSGKTVKPKLYIALGISGAFQHVIGMKNSDLIIAVNKDPKAPIFNFADYGIVEDLFKIVPSLKDKVSELKGLKA